MESSPPVVTIRGGVSVPVDIDVKVSCVAGPRRISVSLLTPREARSGEQFRVGVEFTVIALVSQECIRHTVSTAGSVSAKQNKNESGTMVRSHILGYSKYLTTGKSNFPPKPPHERATT